MLTSFRNVIQHATYFLLNLLYMRVYIFNVMHIIYLHILLLSFLETGQIWKIVLTRGRYQDLHILTCYSNMWTHTCDSIRSQSMVIYANWYGVKEYRPDLPSVVTAIYKTRFSSLYSKKRRECRTSLKVKTIYFITNLSQIMLRRREVNDIKILYIYYNIL